MRFLIAGRNMTGAMVVLFLVADPMSVHTRVVMGMSDGDNTTSQSCQPPLFILGSDFEPEQGSPIEVALRHGILPTKVAFPEVVIGNRTNQPTIDLAAATAPKPFLETLNFDGWDPTSGKFCPSSFSSRFYGESMATPIMAWPPSISFTSYGVDFSSPNLLEQKFNNQFVAVSTPSWNNSYYFNIRKKLIEKGTTGDGCISPSIQKQIKIDGRGLSTLTTPCGQILPCNSTCYSFSSDFVSAFNALPENPAGDWTEYINFCDTYGYQYPTTFNTGSIETFLTVQNRKGAETTYLFGIAGETGACQNAAPLYFDTEGWDEITKYSPTGQKFPIDGVANLRVAVASNFATFYKTYPVSSEPLGSDLNALVSEQQFTYAAPPTSACQVGPTRMPTGMPTRSPNSMPATLSPNSVPTLNPNGMPATLSPNASVPTLNPNGMPATLSPNSVPTLSPNSVPTLSPDSTPTLSPDSMPSGAHSSFSTVFMPLFMTGSMLLITLTSMLSV